MGIAASFSAVRDAHLHRRPSIARRSGSLLLALLLLMVGAAQDGYGLRPCQHHEAPGHAHHGDAHGMGHGQEPGTSQQPDGCTCVGTCQDAGGTPGALPPNGRLMAITIARAVASVDPSRAERIPGRPSFTLPYAQAPPTLG